MPLVLDASATIPWLLDDERDAIAIATLHAIRKFKAIVPSLWRWEIKNALLVAERRGRITLELVNALLADLDRLPIVIAEPPAISASSGARSDRARGDLLVE